MDNNKQQNNKKNNLPRLGGLIIVINFLMYFCGYGTTVSLFLILGLSVFLIIIGLSENKTIENPKIIPQNNNQESIFNIMPSNDDSENSIFISSNPYRQQSNNLTQENITSVNYKNNNSGCATVFGIVVVSFICLIVGLNVLGNNVKSMFNNVNTQLEKIENTQVVATKEESKYLINLIGSLLVEMEKIRVLELHEIYNYLETGEFSTKNHYEEYLVRNKEKLTEMDNYNVPGLVAIKDKIWLEHFIDMSSQGVSMVLDLKTGDVEDFYAQLEYFPDLKTIQLDFRTIAQLGGLSEEEFLKEICPYGIEFGNIHKNDNVIPISETDYEIIQEQEEFCKQYIK